MEYIEGASCAEILRDDGWVEVPDALSIIEQACEGLDYAHRHGVVHRDVKPGNLLRSREGEVKLADFGIAKATEQSSITQVGSVLGTAAYLAPEQARGEEAGPSADLYALGVVTYQLISGRLPYEATSLTELALNQQQEEPPTLDTLVAAVMPELAEAVAIALALDPRDRYQTPARWGAALSAGAQGIAPGAPREAPRSAPPTQATSVLSAGARARRPRRDRRRPPAAPGPRRARARRAGRAARRRAPAGRRRRQPPAGRVARAPRARARDRRGGAAHRARADQGRAAQRRLLRSSPGLRGAQAARLRKHQIDTASASPGHPRCAGRGPRRGRDVRHARASMLAAILDVNHLIEVAGYPLVFLLVMSESSGLPIPGETALIAAAVLASQGKLKIELVIALAAAGAIIGDNIGYLIGRKGGRWLLQRPGAFHRQRREVLSDRRAVLRTPRAEGRVLRALRPRPARVGLVAGRRDAHALALVRALERPRRDHLGDRDRADRLPPRPLRRQRDRSVRPLRAGRAAAGRRQRVLPAPAPRRARAGAGSATRSGPPRTGACHRAARRLAAAGARATRAALDAQSASGRRSAGARPRRESSRCRERCAPTCRPSRRVRPRRNARGSAP